MRISSQIFSNSKNPMMSTISYLSSVLDPKIGAAAAKAALEEYTNSSKDVSENAKPDEEALEKGAVAAFSVATIKVIFCIFRLILLMVAHNLLKNCIC